LVKISDVAKAAGVSTATVSRALNGVPTVDPLLARRAREAAARLGYRPNAVARNLRRRRTAIWALIISDVANPFFTSLVRGVEDTSQQAGYSIFLCNTAEDPEREQRYLAVSEEEQVSGVILSPNIRGSGVSSIIKAGTPLVAVDRPLSEPVDSVLVDSARGAETATMHLLEQGWTNPACITGPSYATTAQERAQGYCTAVAAATGPSAAMHVSYADFRPAGGRNSAASLLQMEPPPDSFFVANSEMMIGVLQELKERGIEPGRDVGLICFDDPPWASLLTPPLSVIAQPAYEMGVQAAQILLERIAAGNTPAEPKTVTLDTTLIVRASSLRRSPASR
jgi:LacI family transcriptional regulator